MRCIERYEQYKEDDFDNTILFIRNGRIKSGRYAHLVKIDIDKKMDGKELFTDGKDYHSGKS